VINLYKHNPIHSEKRSSKTKRSSKGCFSDSFQFSDETDCIDYVGVPDEVIKRAAFVLDAIGNDKHVERLCNENISARDQQYKVLIQEKNLRYDMEFPMFRFLYVPFFFFFPILELNAGFSG
jgi:hypothetical protein